MSPRNAPSRLALFPERALRRSRSTGTGAFVFLFAGLLFAGGCGSTGVSGGDRDVPASLRAWAESPVRWLLLPEEIRRFQRIRTSPQALAFIESFWRRRDPDLDIAGNPFVEEFFRRIQEADLLYGEENLPGSLTDRGRVFILLGAPSRISVTQRATPALGGAERRARGEAPTARVTIEIWGYAQLDLGEAIRRRLFEPGRPNNRIELAFITEGRRTRLLSGEPFLELATQAVVRRE